MIYNKLATTNAAERSTKHATTAEHYAISIGKLTHAQVHVYPGPLPLYPLPR
jgi:hypothetical protein